MDPDPERLASWYEVRTTWGHSLHAKDGAPGERPSRLRLGLPVNSAAGRPLSPGLWHFVCSPRTRVSRLRLWGPPLPEGAAQLLPHSAPH